MALSHLVLLCLVGAAIACQAPGSTLTTVTTSTSVTTVSGGEGGDGPVSVKDREIIRSTWTTARKNGRVAPQILFRLLKRNPALQKKFTTFADVPKEKLLTNGNFLAQSYTILAGLNVIIQSSGSQELLAQEVGHLGASHSTRGVTAADLDEMARVIIEVLQDEIGLSAEAKSAWENGLRALNAGIAKNLMSADDVIDPRTGMSARLITEIRSSWETIREKRSAMVSAAFMKLFKEDASLQKKFAKFADVPMDSLATDAEYTKQVDLVADRIDAIMSDLSSPLKLQGQLNYMAQSHKIRGVGLQQFQAFSRALLEVSGVPAAEQAAWMKFHKVMGGAIDKIQRQ